MSEENQSAGAKETKLQGGRIKENIGSMWACADANVDEDVDGSDGWIGWICGRWMDRMDRRMSNAPMDGIG